MIDHSLAAFVARVGKRERICAEDVHELQRSILPEGLASREEADVLIALDRAVADQDPAWADFLVAEVVAFAVWTSRPTGYVDADTARWLSASLGCGTGPSETARRIAFEVVREAELVDEALLVFVLRSPQRALGRISNSLAELVG
ncbi:MAG TPA: hypothetical protein VHN20_10555 [Beijerinckiaceae bacterium]|nr:hypothetical protein [Beijerinckiaceae bacterium]